MSTTTPCILSDDRGGVIGGRITRMVPHLVVVPCNIDSCSFIDAFEMRSVGVDATEAREHVLDLVVLCTLEELSLYETLHVGLRMSMRDTAWAMAVRGRSIRHASSDPLTNDDRIAIHGLTH